MALRERRLDRAARLVRRTLAAIGDELREARLGSGLTQRSVGAAVGLSHSQISRIERGLSPNVSYALLVRIGAVVGLDLPLRAFPSGEPIRDAASNALLSRLRSRLPSGVGWRTEVVLGIPGDQRAWDARIASAPAPIMVEAETHLRDVQALSRRLALKQRDGQQNAVVLLVAETRHNRRVLRLAASDLAEAFPIPGRVALAALERGERPTGSAIIVL